MRTRRHRPFRRTATYWLLGLWAVELVYWICVGTVLGCYLFGRFVAPYVLKGVGLILAFTAFCGIAGWAMLHGRKVNRKIRSVDSSGNVDW